MRKLFIIIASAIMVSTMQANAQDSLFVGSSFGLGLGIDYGGIGGRYTYSASNTMGIFGAVGFNLVDLGFNAGMMVRLNPGKKTCAYLIGMYGYNGVIKVEGGGSRNKSYYGPSLGAGLEFHGRNKTKNFFNLELLLPIRPQSFYDEIDEMKSIGYKFESEPLPVGFSVGYHFGW